MSGGGLRAVYIVAALTLGVAFGMWLAGAF